MKQTIRTFIAVTIDPVIRQRAVEIIRALQAVPGDVKWVEPENLHFTLKFLGDVDSREIYKVCQLAGEAVAEMPPFEFEVHGAGAFPNLSRPRTFWLGARQGHDEMIALADRLEDALQKLGFRRETRQFQPHLTVGRLRQGGRTSPKLVEVLQEYAETEVGQMSVDEITVYSSVLSRTGPTYEALAHLALDGQ
jgi:2'-5' RNA ligase